MELVITRLELDRQRLASSIENLGNEIISTEGRLASLAALRESESRELDGLDAALTLLKNDLARQALRA